MVYRDERAELRTRIEALSDELAEMRESIRRLEVAAAAGALRGLSEEVALQLRQLEERVARLENAAGTPDGPRARIADSDASIRRLVDQEATLTGRKPRRTGRR